MRRKLQIEHSVQTAATQEVSIIDGCVCLWCMLWPTKGTVEDDFFLGLYIRNIKTSDVHHVFGWYYVYSIKVTHETVANTSDASHKLRLNAPLPTQSVILNDTENKVKLIDWFLQQVRERLLIFLSLKMITIINLYMLLRNLDLFHSKFMWNYYCKALFDYKPRRTDVIIS